MLRIIVISLFVANLLLLGFQKDTPVVQPETTVTQSVVKDSAIPTIHLFSEMIEDRDLLTGNRRCFSLGPFHALEDQDEIRTRLLEVSTSISERQTEALVEKGYWVFMPPYTSLLEANEEVMSLRAQGLEDISVVYGGDWENAISLGYFMRQENALRRKKDFEDRGYAPLMRVQRQAEPRYWLEYEQSPGSELITLDMQNRPNDFMQRALPCPDQSLYEVAGADSKDPVEELAQQQIPEAVNNPDPGEVAGSVESIESTPQETVETVPQSTVEVIGSGKETDVAESIENTPEDAVETLTDAAIETVPESTDEVGSGEVVDAAEGNENEPVESAGALLDQAIETVPDTPGEVGSGEESEVANGIESMPQDAVESSPDVATETDPENTGEVEAGGETDIAESTQNAPPESAEVLLYKAVGTGPEWFAEPEAGEDTDAAEGTENLPVEDTEDLLNPGMETESESGGETGTGEG
ncbi:MAG: hypothetical protein WBN06_08505 [Lysobacterales bacterium]